MKAKTKTNATPTAEDAYLAAHHQAQNLVKQIGDLLFSLPAPGDDEFPVDWAHVGSVNEINRRLASVVAFINGTEK